MKNQPDNEMKTLVNRILMKQAKNQEETEREELDQSYMPHQKIMANDYSQRQYSIS